MNLAVKQVSHQQYLIKEVLEDHAPLKNKKIRAFAPPFMNTQLRKSIMKKKRLQNRFLKFKRSKDWEAFRVQRNYTTKLRRNSIKNYFLERCQEGPKNENFYKTIKPFLSRRNKLTSNLMINEGQDILTDPTTVAESMNTFYANIASEIGSDNNMPDITSFETTADFIMAADEYYSTHHSISNIRDHCQKKDFTFKEVNEALVDKIIQGLNPKKATGMDNIPAKALIAAHDELAAPFARLFNKCIQTSSFPSDAKRAEIIPIYKKNDSLEKKNHRPVSILTSSSKILENIMDYQLKDWLNEVYNIYLAAF